MSFEEQPLWETETLVVKPRSAFLMYCLGLFLMVANKFRRALIGYTSPRPFSQADIERGVKYVLQVVEDWEKIASNYTKTQNPFLEATILEIGPGPDLGTGLVLLSKGAHSYHAIDLYPLAYNAPKVFYQTLFEAMNTFPYIDRARKAWLDFHNGRVYQFFKYQQVDFPELSGLTRKQFDIVLSQAVFEHISDPRKTLISLLPSLKPGAILVNEIDLSTHTHFLRSLDPLNILRYSQRLYSALSFSGSPNRLRMSDYRDIFESAGLKNVLTVPRRKLSSDYTEALFPSLWQQFQKKTKQDLLVHSFWCLGTYITRQKQQHA
jgi:SAM-dependent methyltransferase